MGKQRKKNRPAHGKDEKIVSIEERRRDAAGEVPSEAECEENRSAADEKLPDEARQTSEDTIEQKQAAVSAEHVSDTAETDPAVETGSAVGTGSAAETGTAAETGAETDQEEEQEISVQQSDDQEKTADVKILEVDITDGQAKGSRRAEREELALEELEVTLLELEEQEAEPENLTNEAEPGQGHANAEDADAETERTVNEDDSLQEEDNRSWQEELAYLESEEYAPSRKKEINQETAAEEAAEVEMRPVEQDLSGDVRILTEKAASHETEEAPGVHSDAADGDLPENENKQSGEERAQQESESEAPAVRKKKKKAVDPVKRKQRIRLIGCSILTILILSAVGLTAYLYNRFAPTTKRMDTAEYYQWMVARARGEESVSFGSGEAAVILQDEVSEKTALIASDRVYLNYDMVREHIFTRFYWDSSLGKMLYTTADDTWQIPLNSADYQTKEGTQTYEVPVFLTSGEEKYICADFLDDYVNITCENYAEDNHVLVTYEWGERSTAKVLKNTAVRFGADVKRLVLTNLRKGDEVFILGETEDGTWKRVLTADGYIGWTSSKRLSEKEMTVTSHEFEEETIPSLSLDEKVNLAWHQIDNTDGNKYFSSATAGTSGVNVISPTWYALVDNAGNFSSYSDKSYVTKAHNKNMQVWALISNFSENMSTAELTASYEARSTLIANLIAEAEELGLDGINIDFESITEAGGYGYVQFIRELSVATRKNGLILSVDIPVPMPYNTHYDRAELGRYCDYVIMMGYDEHYAGSEAGSVASLSFEENGIRDSIAAQIPADKLISGIPFYTRLWYTSTAQDGSTSTWSEAYGMDTVAKTLDTYDVVTTWDEETQQNYAEWTLEDGTLCQIWLEDEDSIALKAKLVDTYALGGIAEWVLGFERDSIWPVIARQLSGQ